MPELTPEIVSDLDELIQYNWSDEEHDYLDCLRGSGNENGMFPLLVRLHNWLHPDKPVTLPRAEIYFDSEGNELPRDRVIALAIEHMRAALARGGWKPGQLPQPITPETVGELPDDELLEWATDQRGRFPGEEDRVEEETDDASMV
jgi:hypothetical protein